MKLDSFTRSYIETALWSSTDNSDESGGEPLDSNYSINDIAPATLAEMQADCADFQQSFGQYIAGREERAGHDFWLTRNGHGAGFWDGNWREAYDPALGVRVEPPMEPPLVPQYASIGDFLTAMSKPYGSYDLYIGDDGQIHGQ